MTSTIAPSEDSRAYFRSILERETNFIKPIRQDVLSHDGEEGSILEPLILWVTQEFRAFDILFRMPDEIDRTRKRKRGKGIDREHAQDAISTEFRRVLLDFQAKRSEECEEVLNVARMHAENERSWAEEVREELDENTRRRQYAEEELNNIRHGQESLEQDYKRLLAEKTSVGDELKLECEEVAQLEAEVQSVRQSLAEVRSQCRLRGTKLETLRQEHTRTVSTLQSEKARSTELAKKAEETSKQTGIWLEKIGRENVSLQEQLVEERNHSKRQLAAIEQATVQQAHVANHLTDEQATVAKLSHELEKVRTQTEGQLEHATSDVACVQAELRVAGEVITVLKSELRQSSDRCRKFEKECLEKSEQCAHIDRACEEATEDMAAMHTQLNVACAERSRVSLALEEQKKLCSSLREDIEAAEIENKQAVERMEIRCDELKARLDDTRETCRLDLAVFQGEVDKHQRESRQSTEVQRMAETKCIDTATQLELARAERDRQRGQLGESEKQITELDALIVFQQSQLERMKLNAEEIEVRRQEAMAEKDELCRKLTASLQTKEMAHRKISNVLHNERNWHRTAFQDLGEEKRAVEAKLSATYKHLEVTKGERDQLEERLRGARKLATDMGSQRDAARSELNAARLAPKGVGCRCERLQQQVQGLADLNGSLRQATDKQREESDRRLGEAMVRIDLLENQLGAENWRQACKDIEDRVPRNNAEVERMRGHLECETRRCRASDDQLQSTYSARVAQNLPLNPPVLNTQGPVPDVRISLFRPGPVVTAGLRPGVSPARDAGMPVDAARNQQLACHAFQPLLPCV